MIVPIWVCYSIDILALLSAYAISIAAMPFWIKAIGVLFIYQTWEDNKGRILHQNTSLIYSENEWILLTQDNLARQLHLLPDAILFKHLLWCHFIDRSEQEKIGQRPPTVSALIVPNMLSKRDYSSIRRQINLQQVLENKQAPM